MGVLCGKLESPTATYEVISAFPIEIRTYPACFVAEIQCADDETAQACETLMQYIGFNSIPQNIRGSPDPSVPLVVGTHLRIPRILPVLREDKSLQLLLPLEYTGLDQVPVPTDPRVVIRSLPERTVAVEAFHGTAARPQFMRRVHLLQDKLDDQLLLRAGDYVPPVAPLTLKEPTPGEAKHGEVLSTPAAGVKVRSAQDATSASAVVDEVNKWTVAQYHSHSTLFFLRKNEVWVHLEGTNPNVAKLQAKASLNKINKINKTNSGK